MDGDQAATGRYTVSEAAEALGISAEAVRSRLKRGSLKRDDEGGTVYVLLPIGNDQTRPGERQGDDQTPPQRDRAGDQTELVDELRERVAFLERSLERRDDETERLHRIIAGLAQANTNLSARVPELEAPREGPESPGPADTPTRASADSQDATEAPERQTPRSWWRRVWGG